VPPSAAIRYSVCSGADSCDADTLGRADGVAVAFGVGRLVVAGRRVAAAVGDGFGRLDVRGALGDGATSARPRRTSVYRRLTSIATGDSEVRAGARPTRTPSQETETATTATAIQAAKYLQLRSMITVSLGCIFVAMPQVLVIEDDQDVREAVGRLLVASGHDVRLCGTALDGLHEVAAWQPHVVVLDLGLPDLDGTAVLRRIRATSQLPVLVATAREQESEMIRLLRAGADDYVVKPYSAEQIEARIAALLRRGAGPVSAEIVVGGLVVNPMARTASLDGAALNLSRREFDLLAHLARHTGTVVTRRQLLKEVWPSESHSAETVDVHLTWLRRKLGERAAAPRYLHTVRGVGIRLSPPEEPGG